MAEWLFSRRLPRTSQGVNCRCGAAFSIDSTLLLATSADVPGSRPFVPPAALGLRSVRRHAIRLAQAKAAPLQAGVPALIIPLQQIIGQAEEDFGPFTEGA
jgi:hypothetical protein